jgi:predicted transcriptional regulator
MNTPPGVDAEQAPAIAPSDGAALPDVPMTASQKAVLLYGLLDAPGQKLNQGEANKKIPAGTRKALNLTPAVANRLREELAREGLLEITRQKRTVYYALTEKGREQAATLERPAVQPRQGRQPVDESTIPEKLRGYQRSYLLLQLFKAEGRTLTQKEANGALTDPVQRSFGMTKALANQHRVALAEQGYLRITKVGRSEQYELTNDGEDLLVASEHNEEFEYRLTGAQLNALLRAAREPLAVRSPAAAPSEPVAAEPSSAELAGAILSIFEELRRERHARSGLVPIHEVRQQIASRYGAHAARHGVLDERIRELWRERRLGLVAISDLQTATAQQLDDSIPGAGNETLFYLEAAHVQPVAH